MNLKILLFGITCKNVIILMSILSIEKVLYPILRQLKKIAFLDFKKLDSTSNFNVAYHFPDSTYLDFTQTTG